MFTLSKNIRSPKVADMFYPGDQKILKQMILEFLEKAEAKKFSGKLKAVICPHAGYIYSGQTAAHAYKLFRFLEGGRKWRVLLLGLSHNMPFSGAAVSSYEKWRTPLGVTDVADIRKEIGKSDSIVDFPEADQDEHSLEVQVPFLQTVLKDFVLYPLILGSVRPDFLANDLAEFCRQDDVITVVSSDLSHYLPYEKAKETDLATSKAILDLNIDEMAEKGDACGRVGILTLMFIAEKLGWKGKMIDYRNSGDTAGDKSRVVGYGAYQFTDETSEKHPSASLSENFGPHVPASTLRSKFSCRLASGYFSEVSRFVY